MSEYVITDPHARATEKQVKMIYALAAKKRLTDRQFSQFLVKECHGKSLMRLTKQEAHDAIEKLLALPDPPPEPTLFELEVN